MHLIALYVWIVQCSVTVIKAKNSSYPTKLNARSHWPSVAERLERLPQQFSETLLSVQRPSLIPRMIPFANNNLLHLTQLSYTSGFFFSHLFPFHSLRKHWENPPSAASSKRLKIIRSERCTTHHTWNMLLSWPTLLHRLIFLWDLLFLTLLGNADFFFSETVVHPIQRIIVQFLSRLVSKTTRDHLWMFLNCEGLLSYRLYVLRPLLLTDDLTFVLHFWSVTMSKQRKMRGLTRWLYGF